MDQKCILQLLVPVEHCRNSLLLCSSDGVEAIIFAGFSKCIHIQKPFTYWQLLCFKDRWTDFNFYRWRNVKIPLGVTKESAMVTQLLQLVCVWVG
jgi:hypothetical protein